MIQKKNEGMMSDGRETYSNREYIHKVGMIDISSREQIEWYHIHGIYK